MRNEQQHDDQNGSNSLAGRIGRRRVRRWSRRARIAAPFLAVPGILGLLILSVDLIEFQPQKSPRASSKPPVAVVTRYPAARLEAAIVEPQSVSSLSAIESPLTSPAPLRSEIEGMEGGTSPAAALFAQPPATR